VHSFDTYYIARETILPASFHTRFHEKNLDSLCPNLYSTLNMHARKYTFTVSIQPGPAQMSLQTPPKYHELVSSFEI